ncbi:MAG: hypothetical protein JW702_05965 [Clostridiales bacterium]|nr:hypothetical protein [Clostridiales bacterium]
MKRIIFIIASAVLIFSGCTANDTVVEDMEIVIDEQNLEIDSLNDEIDYLNALNSALKNDLREVSDMLDSNLQSDLIKTAFDVMNLINNEDWMNLSAFIHPDSGVRVSPYQYVDINNDQVFSQNDIYNILASSTTYNWGYFDGSGDSINLNFKDYYQRFIYDHDFYNAQIIGNNLIVSNGNTINNIVSTYGNASFVEFYFPGFDPQYEGMDWRSLTLVFENVNGNWYLVGIVHGEWTI